MKRVKRRKSDLEEPLSGVYFLAVFGMVSLFVLPVLLIALALLLIS